MNIDRNNSEDPTTLPSNLKIINSTEPLKVLYLTNSFDAPFRYRCLNYLRLLREQNQIANIEEINSLSYLSLERYSLIVLFRLPWNKDVANVIASAKRLNIPIVFDIDDYIFNPDEIEKIPFFKNISKTEQLKYQILSKKLWQTFSSSDYFFGSTEELVDLAKSFGKESFLMPNLMNPKLLKYQKLKQLFFAKRFQTPIISYLSGSNTHEEDFKKISPAVCRVLEQHLDAYFLVVGFLTLDDCFKKFENRIIRLPFIHWKLLPWIQSLAWVNLAPLSEISSFTNSKSALKFFEAGAARVPTIATPTREMQKCIVNGENGFLANTEEDWIGAINFCLDKKNSTDLGLKAHDSSLSLFSFEAQSENILGNLNKIAKTSRSSQSTIDNKTFSMDQQDLRLNNFSRWEIFKHKLRLKKYLYKTAIKNITFSTPRFLGISNPVDYQCSYQSKQSVKYTIDQEDFCFNNASNIKIELPQNNKWKNPVNINLIDRKNQIYRALSNDPFFYDYSLPAEVTAKNYFFFKMACFAKEGVSFAQIFWLSDLNDIYQEEHSIEFPIICDGKVHSYKVNLTELEDDIGTSWKAANNIYKFRMDPISCPGTFKILEMKFID